MRETRNDLRLRDVSVVMDSLRAARRISVRSVAVAAVAALVLATTVLATTQSRADSTEPLQEILSGPGRPAPLDLWADERLSRSDAQFLVDLFERTDEMTKLNSSALQWFEDDGESGLHPVDYLERSQRVVDRLAEIEPPARARPALDYVIESISLERGFVADWQAALEAGVEFESQITHEYAYHEGLHRSQRLLLKAYSELRGVFREANAATNEGIRNRLRAMVMK
jgi:hypothetical protein